jgi:hypothetical protein
LKRFEQQRNNLLKTAHKEEEALQKQLNEVQQLIGALNGATATPVEGNGRRKPRNGRRKAANGRRKHKMSAAGRAAISRAQKLRWAKQKKVA